MRLFIILANIFLIGTAFYLLENALIPFIGAWVLAYLLAPVVDRMSRYMWREVAILIAFIVVAVVFAAIMFGVIPRLQHQISFFLKQLPEYMKEIDLLTSHLFQRLNIHMNAQQIGTHLQKAVSDFGSRLLTAPGAWISTAAQLVEAIVYVVLMPVVAFYLLRDWHGLGAGIESFLYASGRRKVDRFLGTSDRVLRRFIQGQLMAMVGVGVLYTIGYEITGISLAAVLGILAGVVSVVPFASFILAGISAFFIAIAQFQDFVHPAMIVATIAVAELVNNTFLIPLLVGRIVNVHPAAVLLFIFVGGALFGVLGMVLALPLAAVFNAYWSRYGPHNGGSQGNPPLTF